MILMKEYSALPSEEQGKDSVPKACAIYFYKAQPTKMNAFGDSLNSYIGTLTSKFAGMAGGAAKKKNKKVRTTAA